MNYIPVNKTVLRYQYTEIFKALNMETETTDKFQELEKDIQELNSLVELTFISHQYSDIDEFLQAVKGFIYRYVENCSVCFLYKDNYNVLRNTSDDSYDVQINLYEEDLCTDLIKFLEDKNCYNI